MFIIRHPVHQYNNRSGYYHHHPFFHSGGPCVSNSPWNYHRSCGRSHRCGPSEAKDEPIVVLRRMEHEVTDNDKSCKIHLLTPGVKVNDIHVRIVKNKLIHITAERKDSAEQLTLLKYEQKFVIDKRKFDLKTISASYEDGVLVVVIPKRPVLEAKNVEIVSEYLPVKNDEGKNEDSDDTETDDDDKEDARSPFVYSLDLPGVKPSAIQVKFHHNEQLITINATRTPRGSTSTYRTKKVLNVEDERINVDTLRGYLMDGVLTITAEKTKNHKDVESETTDSFVVPVTLVEDTPTMTDDALGLENDVAFVEDHAKTVTIAQPLDEDKTIKASNTATDDGIFEDAVTVETVNEKEDS